MRSSFVLRPTPIHRALFAWIAICFAISALGLGARHGCSASTAMNERLAHHHEGGKAPSSPAAQCDCVGHACHHSPAAPPAPGLTVAVATIVDAAYALPPSDTTLADVPHLLPYATAPPLLVS